MMAACSPGTSENKEKAKYFDIPAYIISEITKLDSLDAGITKSLLRDEAIEQITRDTIDWKKELQPFLEADLNKAALINSYKIDSVVSGNKVVLSYAAVDSTPAIKKVEIFFENGLPDSIYIRNELSNPYYVSKETLIYRTPGNYTITGLNEPRLGKSVYFRLDGSSILPK